MTRAQSEREEAVARAKEAHRFWLTRALHDPRLLIQPMGFKYLDDKSPYHVYLKENGTLDHTYIDLTK